LGNRSSGRMGVALAEEARRRGAEVTLLSANLAVAAPVGIEVVETPTAEALLREALARADADLVLMSAAVADYRPAEASSGKRPKTHEAWLVELEPTQDVVNTLAARRENGQVIVAFGADYGERGLERKRAMLADKKVDLVVYNDVSRTDIGFDSMDNEVILITRRGETRIAKAPKSRIAAAVLDEAVALLDVD
jgi:phosphopantothenoylcysteine decarboxylase/phosphopantothenate--cysteine ligase